VAYVVLRGELASGVEELRGHLQESLPEYMVPTAFVVLESLPLTANGKADRRALPAPQLSDLRAREYEPPQGEIETTLANIWRQLLQVERVGRHDSFFELGGHSLLATRAIVYMRQALKVDIPLSTLFSYGDIAALAEVIFRKKVSEYETEDVERIVQDLESLSDDELQQAAASSSRLSAVAGRN
jgi:acyl carrier protein